MQKCAVQLHIIFIIFVKKGLQSAQVLIYIITQTYICVPHTGTRKEGESMIKVTMLATLLAGLAMGATVANNAHPQKDIHSERDTRIIVEVDRSLESLTKEGIKNVQNIVFNNIKSNITSNIRLISSFNVLNNAFAISINNEYVDAVKALPGVKSVTVDQIRFLAPQATYTDSGRTGEQSEEYGGSENASAITMNKGDDTNEGEGTVIAILDNEFYFRAAHDDEDTWMHETFTAFEDTFDDPVNVRFKSRPDISETHVYNVHVDDKSSNPYSWRGTIDSTELGKEGSLYLNSKVPFYFDYGGEREYYGGDYNEDFDVSSTISYHGSHVASIAAGNAANYKGIAPKAQLVCMKVFTNFKASKVDQALGFSNSSGAYDIPILHALEDCITLGVDGINMSLGSNLDDFDNDTITMKTLRKLSEAGILSAISAGNSGKSSYEFAGAYGNWTRDMIETGILSGYANNDKTMTIASGQPEKTFFASAFKYEGQNIAYSDQVVNSWGSSEYDEDEERRISDLVEGSVSKQLNWVYVGGFGTSTDYVGKDVSDKLAVVNRGSTSFADKYMVAKSKGAAGLIIINNDPTASDFNFRASFGDDKPTIPVAFVLFKDKQIFEKAGIGGTGVFTVMKDEVDVNPKQYTMSTFSSDGAKFDLDLKPEITAPGESIRGAVPPQKKEDKTEERMYKTYEFLSGTSMSAPNYAGAQSVVLSKKAAAVYANENPSEEDLANLLAYRKTVDMRLMSTARQMYDYNVCPENPDQDSEERVYSSPRLQGAGMANIGAAYATDVYLEGYDLQGNPIGKSKVALRNNSDINKGDVKLSFLAHNESNENRTYKASFTVQRPAIKMSNDVVTKDYNYRGEIDTLNSFSGLSYYVEQVDTSGHTSIVERHTTGDIKVGDVFKVTKEIEFYPTYEACEAGQIEKIAVGRYKCTAVEEVKHGQETWKYGTFEELEKSPYLSTQDALITTVKINTNIVVEPGDHSVTLDTYSLTNEVKEFISKNFEYGCYLEGFIQLKSQDGHVDLSMPWMGFYAGEGQSYESAPVVEPFAFDKNSSTIYPSDLVNDIGFSLVGKSNIDYGSTWATTYVEPGKSFDESSIQSNDESLSHLAKINNSYHLVGTDPDGNYYDNPKDNIYVGNAHSSNTMIIQQFVMRSVDDNYFTIKNKATGEIVLKDAMEDMLFGERYGRYPLYKSHVDENYLGSGYIAHRAFAVIPLYDSRTGVSFASGEYEITFNYLLAGTQTWVSNSYSFHIDSDDPSLGNITVNGDKVRIDVNEENLVSAYVGSNIYDVLSDEKGNYIELTKDEIYEEMNYNNFNEYYGSGRLYIELLDKAYGRTGAIIRFKEVGTDAEGFPTVDFSRYTIAEHYSFTLVNDFQDLGKRVVFVTYDSSEYTVSEISVDGYVRIKRSGGPVPSAGGCGGNIATTSVLLASLAGVLAVLIVITRKRKAEGGKE